MKNEQIVYFIAKDGQGSGPVFMASLLRPELWVLNPISGTFFYNPAAAADWLAEAIEENAYPDIEGAFVQPARVSIELLDPSGCCVELS